MNQHFASLVASEKNMTKQHHLADIAGSYVFAFYTVTALHSVSVMEAVGQHNYCFLCVVC